MRNAHERFGWLAFTRALKDTTVRVRLRLDRMIAELEENGQDGKVHLLSVVGGESDVGAAWAAALSNQAFQIEAPEFGPTALQLGEKAECFRGSLNVPGRRRAVRHLIAVSAEMAATRLGGGVASNRTILPDDDPVFILYRLSERFGLPTVPEWAEWFTRELQRRRAIQRLAGLGCSPVLIRGTKERFLNWIGRGLRRGVIQFPVKNGPIAWPSMPSFLERTVTPGAEEIAGARQARGGG